MSNPSIRFAEEVSFPDIEIAQDIGNTIDITSVDALDMGLLANQKKLGSPGRSMTPSMGGGDEIEFVNLDDVGKTNVSLDLKSTDDSFKLIRDSTTMPPARPIAPTPQPAISLSAPSNSATSSYSTGASGSSSGGSGFGSTVKNWFGGSSTSNVATTAASATESSSSGGGLASGIRGWFSGSGSGSSGSASQESAVKPVEYLTPEQEYVRKTEALTQLERMDRKGITGNKMTMANTLEEITGEVERRKDSKALEASIRFQRSMLTTVTNGMEFLNSRFDPLGVRLDGWSEQVNENIEDYDEIFEELYDKYKDKSKVAPEVRLIMSLGLSAAMCHVTNTMFKSKMPGMDDILRNNPELARQFAQAAATQAVGPGFANFVGMGMSDRQSSRRPSAAPQSQAAPVYSPIPPPPSPPQHAGMATARREMRGPSGVDDILRSLNQAGEGLPDRSVPPPASPHHIDMDDIRSVHSGFTTATDRAAGRSRRRTAQPVGATLTLNV